MISSERRYINTCLWHVAAILNEFMIHEEFFSIFIKQNVTFIIEISYKYKSYKSSYHTNINVYFAFNEASHYEYSK